MNPPVMIYTMAKVGTSSMANALRGAGIKSWGAHWLTNEWPDSEFGPAPIASADCVIYDNIPATIFITAVREPVARAMSAFMQQRGRYGNPLNYNELYKGLTEQFEVRYADWWFERDFTPHTGFDPYAHSFPHKKGYEIYNHNRHRILIGRLEDLDRVFEDATEELFGVRVKMITRNVWSYRLKDDPLLTHYERFRRARFPEEFLDKCYSLKYAKHFYTQAELDEYRWRWTDGTHES